VDASKQECLLPVCSEGMVRKDGVHCCWPGQGYSKTRDLCVGIPVCPKGTEIENNDHCVSTDKDGDGIPNAQDKCPEEAEDKNGLEDDDGCPDEPKRVAMLAAQERERQQAAQVEAERKQQAEEAERQKKAAEEERQRQQAEADARAKHDAEARARQRQEEMEQQKKERQDAIDAANSKRTTGFIVLGVGAGVGALGGLFAFLGNQQYSSVKNGGLATGSDIQSAASAGKTESLVGIATGVVGGGLALTGAIIALSAHGPAEGDTNVALGPVGGSPGMVFSMKLQ
jgi:hypothetical protein